MSAEIETIERKAEPFGTCPACSVLIAVTVDDRGGPEAFLHPLPTCDTFDRLSAEQYLDYVLDIRDAERRVAMEE